jgi:hypothetical protein
MAGIESAPPRRATCLRWVVVCILPVVRWLQSDLLGTVRSLIVIAIAITVVAADIVVVVVVGADILLLLLLSNLLKRDSKRVACEYLLSWYLTLIDLLAWNHPVFQPCFARFETPG